MARNADTLAGLAALAGAAYLYKQQKDKDAGPKGKADTGPGYKSTETRKAEDPTADKETKRKILETITTPKEKSNDTAGNKGVLDSNSSNVNESDAKKSDATSVANVNNPTKPAVKRQDRTTMYGTKSGVMGGATLPYASSAKTSASPMKDTVRSKADAQKLIDYHKEAGKTGSNVEYKTEPNGATTATAVKKPKTVTAVPLSDINREADKSQGPFYRGKQNDIFDREIDAMGNKKGGAIKKMASGGMAASRRGDGIAQRGKTRGKMC